MVNNRAHEKRAQLLILACGTFYGLHFLNGQMSDASSGILP
jgi:hypothetical protein